jgi:hydrogenase-4 component B
VVVEDHFWGWIYLPLAAWAGRIARLAGLLQQGRISIYLLYSFVTLIAMLVVVRL